MRYQTTWSIPTSRSNQVICRQLRPVLIALELASLTLKIIKDDIKARQIWNLSKSYQATWSILKSKFSQVINWRSWCKTTFGDMRYRTTWSISTSRSSQVINMRSGYKTTLRDMRYQSTWSIFISRSSQVSNMRSRYKTTLRDMRYQSTWSIFTNRFNQVSNKRSRYSYKTTFGFILDHVVNIHQQIQPGY